MEVKEAPALVGDVFFRRIGVDVPVARSRSESFWKEIPARGLAVSNTYGFTFFAHPDGFAVARTAHLCQLAQELKEHTDIHTTAKSKSLKSVDVSDVRSLVLSSDELVLAVITGRKVHFYDLSALIHKSNSNPCETISTGSDGSCVRDFSWSPLSARAYIMLSTKGKLVVGTLGQFDRSTTEEGVLAACWSPDGHHMAYATLDSTLSIRTADLAKKTKIEIPQVLEPENEGTVQVDTVNWVRPDSIMLGCVRTSLDEDDEFQLLMIGCNNGDMAEENTSRISVSFEPLFSALEGSILPSNSGPHLLVEYVSQWHMAVATSRRSVDDHIFLLAWSSEAGQYSPYSMEMANDAWRPRIELTENRSDNIVVGMGIDRTSAQIQMADPRDETGSTMLPSCPVLLCLTLEGKLSLFLFARWGQPNVVTPSLDLPMCSTVGSDIAEQPSVGIASDAAAAELDAGHHESDEESTEDGITSEESDVSESGDFETVREEPEEDSGCAPQGPAPSVDSTPLKEVSASVTNEYEHSEAEKQLSSNPLPVSSPEKVALYGERTQQEKVAGELTAPELLPQNTSLFERFTKVAPQPDSTTTPAHVSEAWDVGRLSPINLFDDRSSRGHQIGAKLQHVKAEKPMGSVASALEGMYRPYSSVNTSSQVIQHVEKPYSSMSIKESLPAVPSSIKMQAVAFNQPSTQATGVRTVTPDVSQGLGGASIAKKTEQKATAATKPSGFQKRPKENQAGHMPGVSEIEADFSTELEKVREMADVLDNLMSSLQGHLVKSKNDKNSPNAGATFEEVEEGATSLSAEVKEHKKMLIETQPDVEALLEDTTRVDAWRTHVQSLLEQYADVRYRELWLHQKLHPQLQRSRTSVVEADQLLKQRLADLEKHLESLELNHRQQMRDNLRRKPSTSTRSQGQYQVLQNLYNTVNTQREVAEKLAHRVTLQMNELNISSTSTSASQRTAQPAATGILRSLGVNLEEEKTSCNGALFGSPVMKQGLSSRDSTESALQTPSRQQSPREALSAHLDTTRRRRDSMDMAWVGAGAAKTTIKRTARIKPIQSLSTNQQEAVKSQLRTFRRTQKITHDSTQAPHLTNLSVDFSSPQQKPVTAIRTTVLSRQTEDNEQPNRDDWTLPPVDKEEKLLSSAPIPGWQFANQEQASSSLFKWASTNSSQTMSSSQNGASCNSSPSAVLNSSAGVGGTRTRIAIGSGIANVSQHGKLGQSESTTGPAATSQTTSSPHKIAVISQDLSVGKGLSREHGLAAEAATTDPKSSAPSYRPSLSRKLDLDPESRYQKYGSEIRSADFDEEERQQSPRDSKMAKTRESGMNGGFGFMRERLTAFGNVGGRSSTLSSSASSLVDTSPSGLQALTTQAAPERASGTSAAGLTGSNGFGASIPSPAVISTTGTTTDVGSSGNQKPEMSRAPPPESSAAKGLDPSQPAAVLADVSALGRNKSPPAAPTTPVTEQVLFPKGLEKPAQSTAPVVSMAPVVPAETEAAVPTASANLTTTAETPSLVFSPTPSAVRFGSPPLGGESPGVAQVSGGFSTSFPRFGASSSPSSPSPLFGQPSSTQGTRAQQFSFQKPSPSAILPSQLAVTGDSEEEGMEEEAPSTTTTEFAGFGGFGGLGLGTSSVSTEEKPNPFGVKSSSLSPNLGFGVTAAGGQLFRPASFSLPAAQSSPPSTGNLFGGQNHSMTSGSIFGQSGLGSGSTSAGFGSSTSFGQAAKVGQGQQALGDALGAFGQTRQLGSGFGASGFSAANSIGGFPGTASGGGFASAATGGGFASAATGGGFASAATGGGFASAATGGGFASAATGGGFAGVAAGGGFAGVAQGGGFAGSSGGASFGGQSPSGGFQSFSANQGSTGFGGFGASPGFGAASQAPLFTQMRK